MNLTALAGIVILIAIALYGVLGGADFGGGVWDLFASGARRDEQRAAITHAIGPVWEANHVWLIYVVVALFTCFPRAFADIATGLYAPLMLALVGIVMRGAAFVFRNYTDESLPAFAAWTVTFGIASLLTPFFLGDAVGGIATGHYAWRSPFALSIGLFAVAVCAQVAAVFLVVETRDEALRAEFRVRAVRATLAVWIIGLLPAGFASQDARALFSALSTAFVLAGVAAAMLAGFAVILCLSARRDHAARALVVVEAVAILAGWFFGQAPDLIPGRFTYAAAASAPEMIAAFLVATAAGAVVLFPSMYVLFRVFKVNP